MCHFRFLLWWLLALGVTACSRSPDVAEYSVEEYRHNAELRHAQVARCHEDPGTLRKTPDCINAQAAAALDDRTRLRDAPPVDINERLKD